jgi:hypothetical protein
MVGEMPGNCSGQPYVMLLDRPGVERLALGGKLLEPLHDLLAVPLDVSRACGHEKGKNSQIAGNISRTSVRFAHASGNSEDCRTRVTVCSRIHRRSLNSPGGSDENGLGQRRSDSAAPSENIPQPPRLKLKHIRLSRGS